MMTYGFEVIDEQIAQGRTMIIKRLMERHYTPERARAIADLLVAQAVGLACDNVADEMLQELIDGKRQS
jgi:hypothetical protein